MSRLNAGWKGVLAIPAVMVMLTACGTGQGPSVSGVAQADGPVVGRVTVVDGSAVPLRATGATGADGSFKVDTAGMNPPYLLKVEGTGPTGTVRLFSATADGRAADVNPITSAAFSGAAGSSGEDDDEEFERGDGDGHHGTADKAFRLLAQLRTALAPLLERYGITDPGADRAAVRRLLEDVKFEVRQGVLTVTNRATGGVIFTGSLDDLASGTFDPAAMPPGPGTPPPTTGEGATLYEVNCSSCHGPLATSQVRGESLRDVQEAIAGNEGGMGALSGLTVTQLQAIVAALAGSAGGGGGGTPGACAYTYGPWGACTGGTQSRAVLTATPAGCSGTPVLTQACTVNPPPIDGAALYATYCAGCHGNSKKGTSASAIQGAIDANTGGMGSAALRALTPAQVAAISAAP